MAMADGGGGMPQTTPQTTPQRVGAGAYALPDPGAIGVVRQDLPTALSAIRGQRSGGQRDLSGKVGAYRESLMARALQAYLSMIGVGGFGTGGDGGIGAANQGLQAIAGGGDFGAPLRQGASQMLNGLDFSGMDNSQILDILGLAKGAGQFGLSPLANYQGDNAFENLTDRANLQGLAGTDPTHNLATTPGSGLSDFQNIIQRYLALK